MNDLVLIQQPTTPAKAAALPPISVLIERFLYYRDVRRGSRAAYKRDLRQFIKWVNDSGLDLGCLDLRHLIAYKQYLLDKGLAPSTVGNYITVLRLFYKFMSVNGIYKNIAEGVKLPRRPQGHRKDVLSESEGKALLKHLSTQSPRDKAIGTVLIYCGLRTIELSRLLVKDLVLKHGKYALMVHGKGRDAKDRLVSVNDEALQAIKEYMATRPEALQNEPMFISTSNRNKGKAITTTTISTTIKEALRALGLDSPSLTAHSLRHTFAVSLMKAGAPIREVSKQMGHGSVVTTETYLHTISQEESLKNPITDLINGIYN